MDDPPHGMAPLPAEIELLRIDDRSSKFNPPLDQLPNSFRTLRDDEADDFLIAKAASANQCVIYVIFKTVGLILDNGNASLCHIGIRIGHILFGNHGDGSQPGRLDSKAQSCYTGAQNEKISIHFQSCLFSKKFVCKKPALLYIFQVIL